MNRWIARLTDRLRGDNHTAVEGDWRRIAGLTVAGTSGKNEIDLDPNNAFRLLKLRSHSVDVDVYRWILEFEDGSTQNLSVDCLLDGTESRPMMIAGRRLKGMLVEYDASLAARRGKLEVWAHN